MLSGHVSLCVRIKMSRRGWLFADDFSPVKWQLDKVHKRQKKVLSIKNSFKRQMSRDREKGGGIMIGSSIDKYLLYKSNLFGSRLYFGTMLIAHLIIDHLLFA